MKRMSQALEVRRLVDQILDTDPNAQIVVAGDFNASPDEVTVMAIRGDVENTGNADLVGRVLVPIEHTIPAPARFTLYHQGRGEMLDHMLITRNLLAHYRAGRCKRPAGAAQTRPLVGEPRPELVIRPRIVTPADQTQIPSHDDHATALKRICRSHVRFLTRRRCPHRPERPDGTAQK